MPGFKLTDLNGVDDSESEMGGSGKGSPGGFRVSFGVAFVLTFLAIAIAVLVGLIVHFAEKDSFDRQLTCTFPETWRELLQQYLKGDPGTSMTLPATTSTSQLGTSTPGTSSGTTAGTTAKASARLPGNVVPISYDLELKPDIYGSDPSQFSFTGSVSIVVKCVQATRAVVMNAKDLTVRQQDVRVRGLSDGKDRSVASIAMDDELERLTILVDEDLKTGDNYSIAILFSGPLTDDLAGLYLSSYKRGNQTVYMATTQFESPDAREAFPCFDEPALKATFNVTLLRKPPFISLSNMKIRTTEARENGYVADVYQPTPKMSTYLLAFIICDFSQVNGTTKKGIEFRIWARSEYSSSMEYALATGMSILDYYGDYFGTDFPLQKQEMIAIPDFAAGAMENWGLITYRETALLYTPGKTSESYKQYVTDVIAHELAHQWFGNLVTLAWWDDLWLNEGFASYVEYIGMDRVDTNQTWKVWEQFATDVIQTVFSIDQLTTSHPLYVPVQTVHEMEQYFDSISYEKGASVIRMIKFCLGEGIFQRGLQRYLRDHAYSNANHTDLWTAWAQQAQEEGNDIKVADIMDTWTLQMGFPVVKLTSANGKLTASQKRFLINPDTKNQSRFQSPFGYRWHVPVTVTSSKQVKFNVTENDVMWMTPQDETKILDDKFPLLSSGDWILGNIHQYGYYRVNYDTTNWEALMKQLKTDHKVIPPINRAQIIDDAWNLASAGETDVAIALGTLDYLDSETEYVPWQAAAGQLGKLKTRLSNTDGYGALLRFIIDKVKAPYTSLGFDDSKAEALESYTRVTVASLACGAEIKECVDSALDLFRKWRDSPQTNPIPPSMSYIVYCTSVREGGEAEWYLMLERFRQESNPSLKTQMMRSLACTTKSWLLGVLLEMSLQNKDIKRNDGTGVIGYVAANIHGRALAWDFVRENWNTIIRDFGQSSSRLNTMIKNIVGTFRSPYKLQQLKTFIGSLTSLGQAEQTLNQAVETVEANIQWHMAAYPKIADWLNQRGYREFEGSATPSANKLTLEDVLLPSNLKPIHYDVAIQPNFDQGDPQAFTFNGSVIMTFTCINATDKIVLHASKLDVANIELRGPQSALPKVVKHDTDKELEFLTIQLDASLQAATNYSVSIDFEGKLSAGLDGFYLSSYEENNQTIYLGTTQMEPTAARKAFPCMDEPAYKATFSITVVRPQKMTTISNMDIQRSIPLFNNKVQDEFQETKPMSTYLVAFLVCDFEKINGSTPTHNIRFDVWGRRSMKSQLTFALDVGTRVLDYFETYFDIPFPLPKQSMAAIPDFSAGAMENWGLITYRETRLLIEEGVSSASDKELAAITVAHELAHMWFGDLVTPQWWNDIWLNEGFATYLEFVGVDHVYPDWREFDRFLLIVVHTAMGLDGLTTSHPLYVPVATPSEINEVFDHISYYKGASVIRMINHAVGEATFKEGLKKYLLAHQYGNARHQDLWRALAEQAALENKTIDVASVMDTWTLQMNFPLVTVGVIGTNTIRVTQQRYLSDPNAIDSGKYNSPFGYKWSIPFTYTTNQESNFALETTPIEWIDKSETTKNISLRSGSLPVNGTGWVLGNVAGIGYYRVNYDPDNWERLAQQLKNNVTKIHRVNRAQLINDAWSLAGAGYVGQEIALKMLEYLDTEEDEVPWDAAKKQLSFVDAMLSATEIYGGFKKFIASKTEGLYRKYGMNNTGASVPTSILRSTIVTYACGSGVTQCVKDAQTLFSRWRQNSSVNEIFADVREGVYCTAIRKGSVDDWDFMYDRFQNEANVHEKIRLVNQLSCTNELWILSRLLDRAVLKGEVRAQDGIALLSGVIRNPIGTSLAWQFVRNNWDLIFQRYTDTPFSLTNLVNAFAGRFNTRTQLEELKDFINTHPNLGSATRAFQAAVETTNNSIRWMDKNYDVVKTWLTRTGYLD